jgi:hypothetical protein
MTEDSRSRHSHALPNYEKAVILRDKLEGYVLNPTHDEGRHKARVFKSALGFEQSDWEELKRRILDELPYHEAISQGEGLWGRKYLVTLPLTGLNGNTADVETVWLIRPKTDFPALVTTLVAKR